MNNPHNECKRATARVAPTGINRRCRMVVWIFINRKTKQWGNCGNAITTKMQQRILEIHLWEKIASRKNPFPPDQNFMPDNF